MDGELPSTKEFIKRSLILFALIFSVFFITLCFKNFKRFVTWKNQFDLIYVDRARDYQGDTYGVDYKICNKTNNTYEISTIYLKVISFNKKYTVPYEVHIDLRPHEEYEETFKFSRIEEYLEKELYFSDIIIKGISFEKK